MLGEYTHSSSHGVQEIDGARLAGSPVQNWSCQAASNKSRKDDEDDGCTHHFGCYLRSLVFEREQRSGNL